MLRNFLAWCFILLPGSALCSTHLGVFLPYIYDGKDLQAALEKDEVLGKYEIKIFQKLDDFILASSARKFNLAILPGSYGDYYSDYKVAANLVGEDGSKGIRSLIVSLSKDVKEDFSVALIDEVGIKNIKSWLLKVCPKCKKSKNVKKAKDLYPLLALGSTDAMLVNGYNFDMIKKEFEAEIHIVGYGEESKYPAIYYPVGETKPKLDRISPQTFKNLRLKVSGGAND